MTRPAMFCITKKIASQWMISIRVFPFCSSAAGGAALPPVGATSRAAAMARKINNVWSSFFPGSNFYLLSFLCRNIVTWELVEVNTL